MPERFGLRYVNASSDRPLVVLLHRALFGSLERFMAILLEHYKGALPPWLSPTQVRILPVATEHLPAARAFAASLEAYGVRAEFDSRDESLSRRIALAHAAAIPLIAILGARELDERSVTVRTRSGQEKWDIQGAVDEIRALCAPPNFGSTLGLCD
jgi:threonyl-tRNA synthetase